MSRLIGRTDILVSYDEYIELLKALRFYANHDNWLDHAEEIMEPEEVPSWLAEIQLHGYVLLDYENDGWIKAEDVLKKFGID
jgi:hypothetical protein